MPKTLLNLNILVVLASATGIYLLGSATMPHSQAAKAVDRSIDKGYSMEKGYSIAVQPEEKGDCTAPAKTKTVKTESMEKIDLTATSCSANSGDRDF